MILVGLNEDDEPVTVQIILRSGGQTELHVDHGGEDDPDGPNIAHVYLPPGATAALVELFGGLA